MIYVGSEPPGSREYSGLARLGLGALSYMMSPLRGSSPAKIDDIVSSHRAHAVLGSDAFVLSGLAATRAI